MTETLSGWLSDSAVISYYLNSSLSSATYPLGALDTLKGPEARPVAGAGRSIAANARTSAPRGLLGLTGAWLSGNSGSF